MLPTILRNEYPAPASLIHPVQREKLSNEVWNLPNALTLFRIFLVPFLVVTDVQCRYRIPFRYDDEVIIRTTVAELGSRSIKFAYDLYRGETLHANGTSSHVWLDEKSRKPVRADEEVMRAFRAACSRP